MSIFSSLKPIVTIIFIGLMFVAGAKEAEAIFSLPFLRRVDRPACSPIMDYSADMMFNPKAYSQIDDDAAERDCSNYGFPTFARDTILSKTTLTCGEPIYAEFSRLGQLTSAIKDELKRIEASAVLTTSGVTSLSERTASRNEGGSATLHNELGSLFSNNRNNKEGDRISLIDTGLNLRIQSQTEQVKQRLDYCNWLAQCESDPWSDERYIERGIPFTRCVNAMNYEVPGIGVVHEKDICSEVREKLGEYTNPADYFSLKNPNRDEEFVKKFMAIEPFSKARELMVVCTDSYPGSENRSIARLLRMLLPNKGSTFDCEEVLIPPGLVAACQGVLNQTMTFTSKPNAQDVEFYAYEAQNIALASSANGTVYYPEQTGIDTDSKTVLQNADYRHYQYARRINAEPQITCMEEDLDSETYGDPNSVVTSGGMFFSFRADIDRPNEGETSYPTKRVFVIAPNGFEKCLNELAYSSDKSMAKTHAPAVYNDTEVKYRKLYMPHPLNQPASFGVETCEPKLNARGEPMRDENGRILPNCRNNELTFETPDVNQITTKGGNVPREYSMKLLKQMFTAKHLVDWAGEYVCDWYAYVRGRRTDGCMSDPMGYSAISGSRSTATGRNIDCEPTSEGYCSYRNFLSVFGNDEIKARNASIVCRNESSGQLDSINKSCFDCQPDETNCRGSLDYSVGLFQVNLHPVLKRCPDAWEDTPGMPREFCQLKKDVGQSNLDHCIANYTYGMRGQTVNLLTLEGNLTWMAIYSNNGTSWAPWKTVRDTCGLP